MLSLVALLVCLPETVRIEFPASKPLNVFDPRQALGAGVDGHERGEIDQIYRRSTLARMRSAGFGPLTYRLRTELAIDAWHWNPAGTWSDPIGKRGYWTSNSRPGRPIEVSSGYRLPRRGSTSDEGENDGYSRILDGDPDTFWKSNPYLDRHFTGEPNRQHPAWIVLDLGHPRAIDSMRIAWGTPYAVDYRVEFWQGEDDFGEAEGNWTPFAGGIVHDGDGSDRVLKLAAKPTNARFIRIRMFKSSGQAPAGARDVRDGLGYAVREIYLGDAAPDGTLHDVLRHGRRAGSQTKVYVSSTDPWHTDRDEDAHVEQPGFDRVFASGLANGLPMLTPVSILFGTPDDAAAELRYLRARHFPVERLELGEEPDGQFIEPEDYGALYIQWADALHRVDPNVQLGGPSFEEIQVDVKNWPVAPGQASWMSRFVDYLRSRGRLRDLAFVSFEWYPFDDPATRTAPQLLDAPGRMRSALASLRQSGLPRNVPLLITEYGYSAFAGQPEVDMAGALLNADTVGTFLSLGGSTAYLYGYEPSPLEREAKADSWGNNTLFLSDDDRRIISPVATYFGARMLTSDWVLPRGRHELYGATTPSGGLITAYPVRRPDGKWSVMLINKDPDHAHTIQLQFADGRPLENVDAAQFSQKQYLWQPAAVHGHPLRADPPERFKIASGPISLPPYSLTVVRGSSNRKIGNAKG